MKGEILIGFTHEDDGIDSEYQIIIPLNETQAELLKVRTVAYIKARFSYREKDI